MKLNHGRVTFNDVLTGCRDELFVHLRDEIVLWGIQGPLGREGVPEIRVSCTPII